MSATRLLLLALGVGFGAAACNEDLLNPMADRQPRVNAYGLSEHYPDGLSMRAPPLGTVPRERIVNNAALTAGRPPGDEYVATFPLPVDAALMQLGQRKYNQFCGTCHGPLGDGNSIVGTQMALRPPPSLLAYADRPVGYIYEVATNGFGVMASFATELSVRERWATVAYIRALQLSQSVLADKLTAEERAQVAAGGAAAPAPAPAPAGSGRPPAHKETP